MKFLPGGNLYESLSGIETSGLLRLRKHDSSGNLYESLSGIETDCALFKTPIAGVAIYTNPYQGLKRIESQLYRGL